MQYDFVRKSAELALQLGQGIRREGRVFYVPSRTRADVEHKIAWAMDGSLICNCESSRYGNECWAVYAIREILNMAEVEERMLPAVQLMPPRKPVLPTASDYDSIERAARLAMAGAVALPRELNTKEKIAALMLYGLEMRVPPMTAIKELFIVHGRVQPSAALMHALVQDRTDAQIRVVESTDKVCTLRITWPSRGLNETWTCDWAEVQRAGLDRDATSAWAKYPRDKLVWHTMKRLLRIYAPGVIMGLAGSLGDDDDPDTESYDEVDEETGEIFDVLPEPMEEQRSSPRDVASTPVFAVPPPDTEVEAELLEGEPSDEGPTAYADAIADYWEIWRIESDAKRLEVVQELARNHGWTKVDGRVLPVDAVMAGRGTEAEQRALLAYLERTLAGEGGAG